MRRRLWMTALAALALAGCTSSGDIDALETQLRQKDDMISELDNHVVQLRQEHAALQTEIAALHESLHAQGKQSLVAEQAAALSKVEKVAFHRLLTSGLNADDSPGDEKMSVLLMPLDQDDELVKLAGNIELDVYDYSLPEGQQRIGQWKFSTDEAKQAWHRGFTASGYLFELPWQSPPVSKSLTLHGRLTAPDGRQFDATQAIAVRLPSQSMAARRPPLAQPVTHTVGHATVGDQPDEDVLPAEGLQTSDRYPLDEIPQRR